MEPYQVLDIWVTIDLGTVLLPDSSKPLPEPILTYPEVQWHLPEGKYTRYTPTINY